jgi:hypothetical protein
MADNIVPISQVPKDIDPLRVGHVLNPLKEDFTCKFDGREITIKAGEKIGLPLPVAVHIAFHLCEQSVRREHKGKINAIKDEKKKDVEIRKSIPGYKEKILDMMKTILETDSDYLEKVNPRELR